MVLVALLLAAVVTNPGREQFEEAIMVKAKDILQRQLNYGHVDAIELGMTLFGDKMVKSFVQRHVVIKNYYLFSTVNINWQGEATPVGGGAFKTVWFSPEIDRKVDEVMQVLKKL